MKKITFITPVANDSRINKRIKLFLENNYECKILSFEREIYISQEFTYISLGKIENRKYWKRIYYYLKNYFLVRRLIKESDYIYCFEIDNTLFGKLVSIFYNKKIIYEIADIREIFFKSSFVGWIMRKVQNMLLKNIDLLVITSENYLKNYINKELKIQNLNYCLIENIPDTIKKERKEKIKKSKKIKIGYFGLFRCEKSLDILINISKKLSDNYEVYLRGYPTKIINFHEKIKNSNIIYEGAYTHSDLNELYNQVDIIWGCYPFSENTKGNWQLARTNRFYEAIEFEKPIILQKNSGDDNSTRNYNFKLIIDMHDEEKVYKLLQKITKDKLIKLNFEITKYKKIQRDNIKKQKKKLLECIENV